MSGEQTFTMPDISPVYLCVISQRGKLSEANLHWSIAALFKHGMTRHVHKDSMIRQHWLWFLCVFAAGRTLQMMSDHWSSAPTATAPLNCTDTTEANLSTANSTVLVKGLKVPFSIGIGMGHTSYIQNFFIHSTFWCSRMCFNICVFFLRTSSRIKLSNTVRSIIQNYLLL